MARRAREPGGGHTRGSPQEHSPLIAHARDPVVPPSRHRAGIPEDLEGVVLRCLAKDPAERFPDAAGLERALGACTCAGDWDQDRAARWWRDAGRPSPPADGPPASATGDGAIGR